MTPPKMSDPGRMLLANYQRPDHAADELFDRDGQIRPVWRPLIDHLESMSSAQIARAFARGDTFLREQGVNFRRYAQDAAPETDWPLSHIPVILHEREWQAICDGLAQRADLLEQVVADLYGPARLVSDGHLPAALIAQNPNWLRPLVDVQPVSGRYLHLLAFEISRNPDGSWFVLSDRTQAPSGAGFALENRMATGRIFTYPFRDTHIRRLRGFFRAFRAGLEGMAAACGGQPAILTPGPGTDTYFEHTYIARYLGLMLLEGEDLIAQDGRLMVRTVEGLRPLGALWRRLDAEFADPLELDENSYLGTPGLIGTLRAGRLGMVNALGTGVLEMRAMMAFLPKISQVLTGVPLALPNIATWWCGQAQERAYVDANRGALMVSDALAPGASFDNHGPAPANPDRQVGQEIVTLSTTPAWQDGKLVPRPMAVRVFAARTPDGWTFMPGGYARIGRSGGASALAMQKGGSVADVWIMGDTPAPADHPLDDPQQTPIRMTALPSRAAENLFWLGRYVERTETAIRLIRAFHHRRAETGLVRSQRPRDLGAYIESRGIDLTQPVPQTLADLLGAARTCASKVRDNFSVDGWNALSDLAKSLAQHIRTTGEGDDTARIMGQLLHQITGFTGLVQENMYRGPGWRFMAFGRALERADAMAALLARFAAPGAAPGGLDLCIEFGDSILSHRRNFRAEASRDSVMSLLVQDRMNPRSILFQLARMHDIAAELPLTELRGRPSDLSRIIIPQETRFLVAEPAEITTRALSDLGKELAAMSDLLSASYLR